MKRTHKLLTVVAAITMLGLLPQAAFAQDAPDHKRPTIEYRERPHSIDEAKERAAAAITRRLEALERISARVNTNDHITDGHKARLASDFVSTKAGLSNLGQEIQNAETPEELKELIPLIATEYRVYLVVLPKSHEVLVSDRMADGVIHLTDTADTVLEAIEQAEASGLDMTEARRFLTTATDKIDAVSNGAVPVADQVIGLSASDWQQPAKSKLQTGRTALEQGRRDIREAVDALKNANRVIKEAIGD